MARRRSSSETGAEGSGGNARASHSHFGKGNKSQRAGGVALRPIPNSELGFLFLANCWRARKQCRWQINSGVRS